MRQGLRQSTRAWGAGKNRVGSGVGCTSCVAIACALHDGGMAGHRRWRIARLAGGLARLNRGTPYFAVALMAKDCVSEGESRT